MAADEPSPGPTTGPATEQEWLAAYDPRAYTPIAVTVDVVALTLRRGSLHVLLVERGAPPHQGCWALPGGFLRAGEEGLDEAAARELAEETGLQGSGAEAALCRLHLEQLGTYGVPERDPRMHVVSVAYLAFAPNLPDPRAGTDAAAAAWHPVSDLDLAPRSGDRPRATGVPADTHGGGVDGHTGPHPIRLAFDHARILSDGLDRVRAKIEYSPLATAFLPYDFTIPELRAVYEAVWGEKLHPGNFHRKVLSVPGFVESTGGTTERGGARGGPRARTYHAGDARLLHPALLRPTREEPEPGEGPSTDRTTIRP
ncbi:NUDIX domain-containing protein [Kitasatospora sp. SUK 42]|uniref:NUDIX hydrolase n=1 Tax=Kitasatospora sp. SUK 42 TaxID=1588882 RepID=UPI0018CAA9DD|nr:NUDIX domain-containing protein [Kitasatospora sp. SUK 42]MBV2155980.1 NUDIX domain-containing protein [Kitasatospora sp. SUK 42]